MGNLLLLLIIFIFVLQKPSSASSVDNLSDINLSAVSSLTPNPLDQLASANIALTVSQMTNLPETTAISNQAESQQAELAMASTSGNIISKPQITETDLKSRYDIVNYVVQPGDSVASIANKFGVTSDSIIWSNNIEDDSVQVGQNLVIPPVSGIVYTVKSGDTTASLAQEFQASQAQVVAYNDSEINGIYPGEQIVIPGGTEPSVQQSTSYNWIPDFGSNGYDYGYCTWYVASVIAVPNNWGNAATWAYYAALSGWNVSSTPSVGAIAQTPYAAGGEGHVAVVRVVNPDGTIWIEEMNSYGQVSMTDSTPTGGWGVADWKLVPDSAFLNYITH